MGRSVECNPSRKEFRHVTFGKDPNIPTNIRSSQRLEADSVEPLCRLEYLETREGGGTDITA